MRVNMKSGGLDTCRELDLDCPLEMIISELFADRIRSDDNFAGAVWAALANNLWMQNDDESYLHGYRSAGDLIAAIRQEGTYLDWYCSSRAGVVPPEIWEEMLVRGWTYINSRHVSITADVNSVYAFVLEPEERIDRCVHYVGFTDDRYTNAKKVFGGPAFIHPRWDRRALREIVDGDLVVFANGPHNQLLAEKNADDINESFLMK